MGPLLAEYQAEIKNICEMHNALQMHYCTSTTRKQISVLRPLSSATTLLNDECRGRKRFILDPQVAHTHDH